MKFFQDLSTSDMWILGGFIVFVLFFAGGESDPAPSLKKEQQTIVEKRSSQSEPIYDEVGDEFDLEEPESWADDEDVENERKEVGDDSEVDNRRDVRDLEPSSKSLSSEREESEPTEVALNTPEPEALAERIVSSDTSDPDDGLDEFGKHAAELREYMDSDEFGSEYAD